MRKSLLAVIAAGGLALGGTGLAMAGEGQSDESGTGVVAQTKADSGTGSGLATPEVANAAQAADLVLQDVGGGRVTGVGLGEENGRAVWKVTFVGEGGLRGAQVDALTRAVTETAADPAVADGASTFDDDSCDDDADDADDDADDADDDADDVDDDDDDDDDGDRQGVEPNK